MDFWRDLIGKRNIKKFFGFGNYFIVFYEGMSYEECSDIILFMFMEYCFIVGCNFLVLLRRKIRVLGEIVLC